MAANQATDQIAGNRLSCERGSRLLFENLNFSVRAGQAMIVRGSNGAGKTSLLRIVSGLSRPADGEVLWNHSNINRICRLYQQAFLYIGHLAAVKQELTVRENLQLLTRFWPYQAAGSIAQLADRVGLRKRLSVPCARLSAGQLRRVSLARLFISTHKLWILDEPLTALDVDFISAIEVCLQQHLHNGGLAILTTHRGIDLGGQHWFTLDL